VSSGPDLKQFSFALRSIAKKKGTLHSAIPHPLLPEAAEDFGVEGEVRLAQAPDRLAGGTGGDTQRHPSIITNIHIGGQWHGDRDGQKRGSAGKGVSVSPAVR